jgi:O-acetyl-ADP-ribose deacetylase
MADRIRARTCRTPSRSYVPRYAREGPLHRDTDRLAPAMNDRIELALGDITTIPADAIVNAANESLAGGGGVDGAIHRAGGPAIMAELEERYGPLGVRRCRTGSAVATGAGDLPARWVIHAVGPVWRGGHDGEPEQLASAYRSSLALAAELGARSVTVPAISAGIYGYPLTEAARVAVETVADVLATEPMIERLTFVLFSPASLDVFSAALQRLRDRKIG